MKDSTAEILEELKTVQVLIRTNNLLISRFIMQLSDIRKELNLPRRVTFFKFELLQDEYNELVKLFGQEQTDKALYRLDRYLLTNKMQCPNNVKKFISNKLKKNHSKEPKEDDKS